MAIKKDLFDFDFKTVSPSDFKLKLTTKVDSKLMKNAFIQSLNKKRIQIESNKKNLSNEERESFQDSIDNFAAPPIFKQQLLTATRLPIKDIKEQVSKDGIKIIETNYERAFFVKDGDNWECHISFTGVYTG